MECIISRASTISRCNRDGKLHLFFTEREKPCGEAYLKEILDSDGNKCSRYFIDLETVSEVDRLGGGYGGGVPGTRNLAFPQYIALVLYDEEIKQGR